MDVGQRLQGPNPLDRSMREADGVADERIIEGRPMDFNVAVKFQVDIGHGNGFAGG